MKSILLNSFFILLMFTVANAQLTQLRVACIGNSITQGSSMTYPLKLGQLLGSHYQVINYGRGGRTLLRKGDYPYWNESAFFEAQDFNPHIIIMMLGTNDSKPQNWQYKDEFYTDYRDFVRTFRKNGRNPQFYVCFPPPAFVDNFGITDSIIHDQIIPLVDSVRRTENLLLIDFNTLMSGMSSYFPDGIHPNNDGYAIMGQFAYDTIMNSPGGFIRTFNALHQKYEQGDSVELYWETSKGSRVTLNGSTVNETDSVVVYPSGNVPYTLLANGDRFSDSLTLNLEYVCPGTIKSLNAYPPVLEWEAHDSSLISWTTAKGSAAQFEGVSVSPNASHYVSPEVTTIYRLISTGDIVDTAEITIPVMDAELIDRALNQTVKAYSMVRNYPPENAVDGDTTTYWISGSQVAGQWIYVDLGKTRKIDRVLLKWGNRFAISYFLQSVDTLGRIKNVYSTTSGDGDIDDIRDLNAEGRILRLLCNSRNVIDSGYVLADMKVFTPPRTVGVQNISFGILKEYELAQNYPNPFNPSTTIRFTVPMKSKVRIEIFDILGRKIDVLINKELEPGSHNIVWTSKHSTGIYFYKLEAVPLHNPQNIYMQTREMVVLK